MKKILMISTGGTIASEPGPDGLVPKVDGCAMVRMIPELNGLCEIECEELLSLDSSNLQPHHWSETAACVAKNYGLYDGFVITHGTDTMAYTAAALSIMLVNLGKPVAITGAQLPIEDPLTDGKRNILNAFRTAISGRCGVWLVFGDSVIDGRCAKKMSTEKFNAFESVNAPCAAKISAEGIEWGSEPRVADGEFAAKPKIENSVFLFKLIPGVSPDILDYAVDKGYKGIVIEGFGAGGVPNKENSLLPALERALKKGVVVVCASQCIYDGVHLDVYDIGVLAARLGALSADRMTVEAACVKLMWALGNSESAEETKALFLG